ncbi:hypothetical protein CPS_2307 [Colwellia psychrerythraea 34H]|uniref:Uncharacterized protein n=1 Tax=Colwellia psychrerythraea (strain 34H / ATCC BAA-681) TaxID=167879 RepID=Q482J0_COLP3|nr:hypothetical protein CPS_2307 [Colwellia psychrerythraea 34H]
MGIIEIMQVYILITINQQMLIFSVNTLESIHRITAKFTLKTTC